MRVPDYDEDGLAPVFAAGVDSAGSVEVDIVPAPIFGLTASSALAFQGSWHHHQRHQLLYAARGTLHLETHHGRWQLPPRRAAWLPAGTTHRASSAGALRIATVYLETEHATKPPRDLRVFGASPLLQAMVLHAAAIGPRPPFSDAQRTFLEAVAAMVPAWSRIALPFVLPVGRSDELRAAMRWTRHHLANAPTVEQAARHASISARTLARRFRTEVGMTWRAYLRTARLLLAMELLEAPGSGVAEVAYEVGFESLGAFARSFRELVGETPSAYRRQAAATHRGIIDPGER